MLFTGPCNIAWAFQTPGYWETVTITYGSDTVGKFSSLVLDGSGNPHISHYDSTKGDLLYSYKDDGGWHAENVDGSGGDDVGKYTSIALDASGYPHISYYDTTNGNLKYAYRDGTGWHVETEDQDTANNVGQYTSLESVAKQINW